MPARRRRFAAALATVVLTSGLSAGGAACTRSTVEPPSVPTTVAPPGCQSVAPAQQVLSGVRAASLAVSDHPFGIVYSPHDGTAFVAVGASLDVLATDAFPPRLVRTVPLPPVGNVGPDVAGAAGTALTHNGRYLLVADGGGAVVVDEARARTGTPNPVLGVLSGTAGTNAIEVSVSPDDHYVFVSQEYGTRTNGQRGEIDVFNLRSALNSGFTSSAEVGSISLAFAVVGSAVSADGRRLYVTSENTAKGAGDTGELSVLDLATLETNPSAAQVATVPAGCEPVRVATTPDGTVWVTARASNALLAFDPAKLTTDPAHALVAVVRVGTAPVGLVVVRGGRRIITADSDRNNAAGATTGLTVVDTHAALHHEPAALGRIATGSFPRECALSGDGGTLLVSDFLSDQVQAINIHDLP
jgi:hypothetical protein